MRKWLVIAGVVVFGGVGTACGDGSADTTRLIRDGDGDVAPDTSRTSAEPVGSTPSEPGAAATESTSSSAGPSAALALGPFFSVATTMDERLGAAATAINGSGPPWASVTDDVADRVSAAVPELAADVIPAGLPRDLLQSVILVYSDLSSRRAAMQSFAGAGQFPYAPIDPLNELANGHEAAERFDADLAAAESRAASTPPITVASSNSREAADVLLLVQYVNKSNFGCDSRGGAVITQLPEIEWHANDRGTIAGIAFEATLDPGGQWGVNIIAC